MKSVLLSIRPKWCELIASGKKTVEVRKTRPNLETPFKCYIYETKARSDMPTFVDEDGHVLYTGRGQVIGEFVCDRIEFFDSAASEFAYAVAPSNIPCVMPMSEDKAMKICNEQGCLSNDDVISYFGDEDWKAYFWHISDLKIYDEPKELSEFWKADKCPYVTESGCTYKYHCFRAGQTQRCGETLTSPPQSYMFVEEV